jgi:DNA-binding transcriptional MerR regulator
MANPDRLKRDPSKLYYSISEVAELVDVKPHVLRYWETQFKMLRPRKNRAGNRSYRAREVQLALRIKRLLYDEKFTIAGARRKLLDERRSGQSQTELNFVGLSQGEFLSVLRRDLEGLLAFVRGDASSAATAGNGEDGHADEGGGLLGEVASLADETAATEAAGGGKRSRAAADTDAGRSEASHEAVSTDGASTADAADGPDGATTGAAPDPAANRR